MYKILGALFCILTLSSQAKTTFPPLPEAVTNNAVAHINVEGKQYLFSFMGLSAGKTYQDVHNKGWQLIINENGQHSEWEPLPAVPSSLDLKGRLASVAVGLKNKVYIFGGYTVAADHSEISTPDVYFYDPIKQTYQALAAMPIPVDDAVALTYQERYIYLISGWHNDGNVNLVQVYDTQTNLWYQASPFLGQPVFGHAGGIVDNKLVVCDGVKIIANPDQARSFGPQSACYLGIIHPDKPFTIDWRTLPHTTNMGRYRMAAAGDRQHKRIIFAGGSTNPYNYNGIGYNGVPSEPNDQVWIFDLSSHQWSTHVGNLGTMDHRGLLEVNENWLSIGGMVSKQQVSNAVNVLNLPKK